MDIFGMPIKFVIFNFELACLQKTASDPEKQYWKTPMILLFASGFVGWLENSQKQDNSFCTGTYHNY
jgi:hypothetical protein